MELTPGAARPPIVPEAGPPPQTLREPEIAGLRRRLLLAGHLAAHVGAAPAADWSALLLQARRAYAADVDALSSSAQASAVLARR